MLLSPGERLGTYEIVAPIGAGGMGEVYRAKDLRLGRDVALKLLPPELATHPERLARFELEARTVASLNHPNIVTLYSVEEDAGTRFLTMELIEGTGLEKEIAPDVPIPRVLEIGITLADALASAHAKGVVHRDIKPANIMFTSDGRLKVLDFGLAKLADANFASEVTHVDLTQAATTATPLSSAGQVLGTIPYMAPEQLRGEPVDARTDLFALGVVLYELAAGQRPFLGNTLGLVSAAILRDAPAPLASLRADLPDALEQVIHRCLEKRVSARIASAVELRDELRLVQQALQRGDTATLRRPRATGTASIAVLPFVNRSRDVEDEYFSDGLADEILNLLARVRGLRVVARTSAFRFRGTTDDIETIGRKLNVATVLEGSVRKSGNRIRVSVQLIQVSDSFHLWSESYDRMLDDIFAVQDDIAQSVVQELRSSILHETVDARTKGEVEVEVAKAAKGRGTHPEAHRLYLFGKHLLALGNREAKIKALAPLKEALALDPGLAQAWYELSNLYQAYANHGILSMSEGYALACDAAQRAIELQPDLAMAHALLGLHRQVFYRDRRGATSIRRALELAPNSPLVLRVAGRSARLEGRLEEALSLNQRSVESDPLSPPAHHQLGDAYLALGRFAEAEAAFRRTLDLLPVSMVTSAVLAFALMGQSRLEEALAAAKAEADDTFRLWSLALVHDAAGERAASDAALRELIEIGKHDSAFQIAEVYAKRGESDAAFAWLEQALAQEDSGLSEVRASWCLRELERDPRWAPFLSKLWTD